MKRFHSLTQFLLLGIFLISSLVACRKKKDIEPTVEETPVVASAKQSDQSGSSAADAVLEDVNDYINNKLNPEVSARMEAYNLPCGVVSVDTTKNSAGNRMYEMKYGNKTPCGFKKKSGTVTFELLKGKTFVDTGAEYKITYKDYVVEILATNDIIKINGFIINTNVSGGPIWKAVTKSATIKHKIRGTYHITYANGQVRERKYFQSRIWSSSDGWTGLKLTVSGDTLINGINVSEIGRTLDGDRYFETQILTDYAWSNCGTTFVGPFVLKTGNARMNVTVPNISPAYFDVEAGYLVKLGSAPTKVNDCTTNAYKINIQIGTTSSTEYQLY